VDVFNFEVPIAGWSSNVTMAASSTFKVSSYLANGTRVVGVAPQNLGEYRTLLRAANTVSFSDSAPAILPNASDGVAIYSGNGVGTADTATNPTRYDVFIGKNKNYKVSYYGSTGRTVAVDAKGKQPTSAQYIGYDEFYDPTTGILQLLQNPGGTVTAQYSASTFGSAVTGPIYFDITVSENALAVGMGNPIYLQYTGNSGTIVTASSTNIPFITKLVDSHGAWNGSQFIAPRPGWYNVSGSVFFNTAIAARLTLSVGGVDKVTLNSNSTTQVPAFSGGTYLNTGDVMSIRSDTGGTLLNTAFLHSISISSQGTN
jgi:hypothetical protein